jgi:hypothetical protein
MQQQTNYIVTQCYGNEGVFYECAYMLLSLSRLYTAEELANTEIWIYTDNPFWFGSFKGCRLPLHYRALDKGIITQWRGKIDFVHRVKIEALKDLAQENKGNFLYVDTDTVFTKRLDDVWQNIENGGLYMHVMEGVVSARSNPIFAKLDKHLRSGPNTIINGKPLHDLAMWNAGVLGFNTTHSSLLDEVLAFTDHHYPKFPKHVVEQFAFSVYFQKTAAIKSAAPFITHYWNLKEARQVIGSFLTFFAGTAWQELARLSALIQMPVLMQEKVNFLHNRSIWDKLNKKQWQPLPQHWGEAVSQL